jgi:DNA-directed RNA polymerase subunit beta
MGVISRMNIGQVFELHLANSLNDLKIKAKELLKNGEPNENVKNYILEYIKIIDNTIGSWYYDQFKEQLPKKIDENFIDALTVLTPPFESCTVPMIKKAMEYTNTSALYKVYDPRSGKYIHKELAVGFMYLFRMVHIAASKISFRGIASYSRKTLQPLGGRKNMGGQRIGEMETACLISHDALKNLDEVMTTKSDSLNLKNQHIKNQIEASKDNIITDNDRQPESVRLFKSYLTVAGLDITKNNG